MKFTTALLLSAYTASTVLATNHMAYVMPAQMPSEQLSSGSGSMADTMPNEGMIPVSPMPAEIPANMPAAEMPAAQMPAAPMVETTAVMMHTAATTMMHQGQMTTIAAPMQHQVTAMPTHVMMPAASAGVGGEAASGGAVGGAAGMTHTVIVGGAGLAFNPTEVTAAIGDKVKFIMMAKNHTVTQSSFAKPCVKLATGMDSGFLPNSGNDTATAPTFEVTVDTTDATWWYCKQKAPKPHCGSGMVFAINPTAAKSFSTFQMMAIAQNGTAAGGSAVAPPAAGATLSVDNGSAPPAATSAALAIAPPAATMIAPGWNNQGNPGACSCACFCGQAAFPQGDGIGSFGGLSGSLPAPWGR